MKSWQIIAVSLLGLVLVSSIACNPLGDGKEEIVQKPVEVVRGDLMFSVSGSGNVEVANEAKLAFGSGGKIDEIYVKEGDKVSKGQALARLDTDSLEQALTQAKVARAQAEVAVVQAEMAQTQAEVALETAKFNLDRMKDVQELKDDIEEAEWEKKIAEVRLKEAFALGNEFASSYWIQEVAFAQLKLLETQADLAELLAEDKYASLIVDEVKIKALQVKSAEQSLEQAKLSVKSAEQSLELAEQSVEHARRQLDEATIIAPFDGLIASVDAKEGDIIPTPTFASSPIIHLIDPTSMELVIEVDEVDIAEVKPGQKAIIEVDALPALQLEGEVVFISLLSKVEAGLIVYEVKIGLDVPRNSALKNGMSTTVDIIINQRSNVLLVPSRALAQDSQGNTIVRVVVDEQTEERAVVTGISDGIETEIVSGLTEGETIVVETMTKVTSGGTGFFQ